MKKFIFIIIAVFMGLTFSACQNSADAQTTSAKGTIQSEHHQTKTWYSAGRNDAYFEMKLTFANGTASAAAITATGFIMTITFGSQIHNLPCEIYRAEKGTPAPLNSINVASGTSQTVFLVSKLTPQGLTENTPYNIEIQYNGIILASEILKIFRINY